MTLSAVLDAGAFDVLDTEEGAPLRQLMRSVLERGGDVRCAAVTLAEVCRGSARTRRAEVAVSRDRGGQRIRVIPTDERLAKLVGAVLHSSGRSGGALAHAHVVAICATAETAVVVTSDPGDISDLAGAIPGTRIVVRRPQDIAGGTTSGGAT